MPELRLVPLQDILTRAQVKKLLRELRELGVEEYAEGSEDVEMEEGLAEDVLTDFMDRLDAQDVACDLYLPAEFEGRVEIGDITVGSAHTLLEALEELREELEVDDEEDDEEEEDLDMDVIEEQLRYTWRIFLRAANTSIDRQIPLQVVS